MNRDFFEQATDIIREIPLAQIFANRYQPRTIFDDDELSELAESIKQHGILQPITLRQITKESYEIIAGERRFRAAKLAGLTSVQAIVKPVDANESAVLAIIENIQREDLTAIEEARSYKNMMQLLNKTQSEIAQTVGKSQSAIANKLRLLHLDGQVQDAIEKRLITERHGRALLSIKEGTLQRDILEKIIEKKMNVSETEKYIELILTADKKTRGNVILAIAKDTKLAINTINQALLAIQQFGLAVDVKKEDFDDYVEFNIRIPKNKIEK